MTARSETQIGGVISGTITGFYGVSTISLITLTAKVIKFVTEVSYNFYFIVRSKMYSRVSAGSSV